MRACMRACERACVREAAHRAHAVSEGDRGKGLDSSGAEHENLFRN